MFQNKQEDETNIYFWQQKNARNYTIKMFVRQIPLLKST